MPEKLLQKDVTTLVKDFVAINFSEYFKSIREEQNLRKVGNRFLSF